jgi:type I restriction enzyme M protein
LLQRGEPPRAKTNASASRATSTKSQSTATNLNLDIFWLNDESLEDSANLPDPDVIAQEIVEDLQAALAKFGEIASDLKR